MTTDERRRYPRKPLIGVVEYAGAEGVGCIEIINISLGGVRLRISGPERPGRRVELTIIVEGLDQRVHLLGQVVWARQVTPYEVGLSYLDVDPTRPPRQLARWVSDEHLPDP